MGEGLGVRVSLPSPVPEEGFGMRAFLPSPTLGEGLGVRVSLPSARGDAFLWSVKARLLHSIV